MLKVIICSNDAKYCHCGTCKIVDMSATCIHVCICAFVIYVDRYFCSYLHTMYFYIERYLEEKPLNPLTKAPHGAKTSAIIDF